jgi:hypothetical protein
VRQRSGEIKKPKIKEGENVDNKTAAFQIYSQVSAL